MDLAKLTQDLVQSEGRRNKAYDDKTGNTIAPSTLVKGNVTIGIGRNLYGKGLTDAEIEYLLKNDIEECVTQARTLSYFNNLSDARQRAVVEMIFNLGFARFKTFHDTNRYLEQGRFEDAANTLSRSLWASQVKRRAVRIISQIREG